MLQNLLSRLKWGLTVCGIILLGAGIYTMVMVSKTPYDLNALNDDEFKSGMIVEGDITFNLGAYEESVTTRNGIQQKSSAIWYYIVPVGDESYIGVAVKANERGAEFDKQTDQTYAWLNEETDEYPITLHVKGKLAKMDSQDKALYKEAFKQLGYSDSEFEAYGIPLYIGTNDFAGWLPLVLGGAALFAVGIVLIVVTSLRKRR